MAREQEKSLKILTRKALRTIRIYEEEDEEDGDILQDRLGRVKVKPKEKRKKKRKLYPNPLLREGKPLPESMQKDFSDAVACVPLEEFDPYYRNQQTFVVIGKKKTIHRFSAKRGSFLLSPFGLLRREAIYILTHWIFSAFIVAAVMINYLLLLLPSSPVTETFEIVFISIYTFELCLKMVARGVVLDKFTCFRIPWSWLDLVIISASAASLLIHHRIFDSIKAFRILKVIPLVPDLLETFCLLVNTGLRLFEMCLYALIPITGLSILAQKLFFTSLRSKCVQNKVRSVRNLSRLALFNFPTTSCRNESYWYKDSLTEYAICGNYSGTRSCPEGYTCQPNCGENPNDGQTSFDSLPWTIFTVIRLIFQDYPQELYNQIWSAVGPWYTIFFIIAFGTGTFAIGILAYGIVANSLIQKIKKANLHPENGDQAPTSSSISNDILSSQSSSQPGNTCHHLLEIFITLVVFVDISVTILFTYTSFPYFRNENMEPFKAFYIADMVFVCLYGLEVIIKIISYGPKCYFKKNWNIIDFSIVILGSVHHLAIHLASTAFEYIDDMSYTYYAIPYRAVKLIPRFSTLQVVLEIFMNTTGLFGSLYTLLIMFILIISFIASVHLGPVYTDGFSSLPEDLYPRWSFLSYPHSILLSLRLLCGEWIETFRSCFLVASYSCLIYYVPAVLIGHLLVMVSCVSVACTTVGVLQSWELNTREKTAFFSAIEWIFSYPVCLVLKSIVAKFTKKRQLLSEAQAYRPGIEEPDWAPEGRSIDGISFTVILISWIPLIIDNVHNASSPALFGIIFYTDIIFALYFVVEVSYKVYYKGPKTCLTSIGWLFDLLLVSGTFANLYLYQMNSTKFPLKETFNLRCIRIFMIISRVYCLKAVGNGLCKQLCYLKGYIFAGFVLWLLFALSATRRLSALFARCIDPETKRVVQWLLIRNKAECLANNLTWEYSENNFDGLRESFVSLTQIGSLNGYAKIIEDAMDTTEVTEQTKRDASFNIYMLFVGFFVFCVFFMFNVVFGVIYFHLEKEESAGMFMTKKQLRKYKERKTTINTELSYVYPKPKYLLQIVYDFVADWRFDAVIMTIICIDIVTFVFYKYQDAKHWSMLLRIIYILILALYTVELVVKLLAWGKYYFRNFWNVLDFVIVLYGIFDFLFGGLLPTKIYPTIPRIARILRFLQFQPLLRRCRALQNFMKSFVLIKSVLFNLLLFFIIFASSFATMGIALFKHLKFEEGITTQVNFQTFFNALVALFELSTFSGWDRILLAMFSESNGCPNDSTPYYSKLQCVNYTYGTAYIIVYLAVSFLIFMNMYLVFIREFVSQLVEQEENDNLNRIKLQKEIEEKAKEVEQKKIVENEIFPTFANCQPSFQEKSHCRPKKKEVIREVVVKEDEFLLESVPEEPEQTTVSEQDHQLQRLSSSESHSIFSSREFLWNSNIKVGSSSSKIDMLDCRHKAKFNYEDLGRSAWSPEKVESIILSKDDSDPPVVILINSWQNDVLI